MQEKLQKLIASGTASDATLSTFRDLYKKRIQNILNYNKTLQARYSKVQGDVRGYKPEITSDPILTPAELADINANVQFADEAGTLHESVGAYDIYAGHIFYRQPGRHYTLDRVRKLQASADAANADSELVRNLPDGFELYTHTRGWEDQLANQSERLKSRRIATWTLLTALPSRTTKSPYVGLVVAPIDPNLKGTTFNIQRTNAGHVLSSSELKEATEAFTAISSNMDLYSPDVNNWSIPGVRYQFGIFDDDPEFKSDRGVLAYASNIGSVVKIHTGRIGSYSEDFTHRHTNGDKELKHEFAAEEAMKNGDLSMLQYVMFHETGHILEYKRVPIGSWYRYMKNRKPARRWAEYKSDFGGNTPISGYSKESEAEHIAEAIAKYLATGEASPQFRDFMIKYAIANGGQDFIKLPKPTSAK